MVRGGRKSDGRHVSRDTRLTYGKEINVADGIERDNEDVRGDNARTERNTEAPVQTEAGGEGRGLHGENSAGAERAGRATGEGEPQSESSITKSATAAGREAYGLSEAQKLFRKGFGKSWELAQKKEARSPGYGRRGRRVGQRPIRGQRLAT